MRIPFKTLIILVSALFVAVSFVESASAGYRSYRRSTRYSTRTSYSSSKTGSTCSDYPVPATFYVDGKNGNDGGPGSEAYPFRTIQRGIDAAEDHDGEDVVQVAPLYGVYHENVLISDDRGAVTLRGCSSKPLAVVIDGDGSNAINANLDHDVTIQNLMVTDGQNGILVTGGPNKITIWGVTATKNNTQGILVEALGEAHLHHISASWNPKSGVHITLPHTVTLEYIDASYNGDFGVQITDVGDVTLKKVTANYNGTGILVELFRSVSGDYLTASRSHATCAIFVQKGVGDASATLAHTTTNHNQSSGVCFLVVAKATLRSFAADWNAVDGVIAADVAELNLSEGTASGNGKAGIEVVATHFWASRITANENGMYGFIAAEIERCELRYSEFVKNGIAGIYTQIMKYLELVSVEANSNGESGLRVEIAERVIIQDGWYKFNGIDGIRLQKVAESLLKYVKASYNEQVGLALLDSGFPTLIQNWIRFNGIQDILVVNP